LSSDFDYRKLRLWIFHTKGDTTESSPAEVLSCTLAARTMTSPNGDRNTPFQLISKSAFESERAGLLPGNWERQPMSPAHEWIVRDVMPPTYERYCALLLPWRTHIHGETHEFEGFRQAYRAFNIPVPNPLTLTTWHHDFQISERFREVPEAFRILLDEFSRDVDFVFVRCCLMMDPAYWYYWKIDRATFIRLPDPFVKMPQPSGSFDIFPHGASWYIVHRDDEPLLYVGGSSSFIERILGSVEDKALPVALSDRYY